MKTTNTKKDPKPQWLMGGNPDAIEAQESQGQSELIASEQLPRKCNYPRGCNAAEQYHKMGIKVFTTSKGDDLFLGVKLPEGWSKQATDHSMWNNLVDDKGRIRATFFYKAAFYDRDAFVNFEKRYSWTDEYIKGESVDGDNVKKTVVKDNATGEFLFETEKHTWRNEDEFHKMAKVFIDTSFPDHENVNAYW